MGNAKKKSSGWRPPGKRRRATERDTQQRAARVAEERRDCERLRLWSLCPVRRCRRLRACAGEPEPCLGRYEPELPDRRNVLAPQILATAPATPPSFPVLSAAEAAAAIAASIANDRQREWLPGEELEGIVRDGQVHYEPRRWRRERR
jgi:hypothetical protein